MNKYAYRVFDYNNIQIVEKNSWHFNFNKKRQRYCPLWTFTRRAHESFFYVLLCFMSKHDRNVVFFNKIVEMKVSRVFFDYLYIYIYSVEEFHGLTYVKKKQDKNSIMSWSTNFIITIIIQPKFSTTLSSLR